MSPLSYIKLAAAAALALALLWGAKALYDAGKARAAQQIEQANDASEGKADAAERGVLECPPGKWNREGGKCGR